MYWPTYPKGYNDAVNTFQRTAAFDVWLSALKDGIGKARIAQRIRAAELGHFGDTKPVGEGVSEMRIHVGPGSGVLHADRQRRLFVAGRWQQSHPAA